MSALGKRLRRWLYLTHRWLGILTGLLFATWFVSGVVMMYVGFPRLTDAERRAALPPIAWDRVAVEPEAALA
ncbi:PepSY domain-containing protein, partial [Methylobacterium hispanicum]